MPNNSSSSNLLRSLKLAPSLIDSLIVSEDYHRFPGTTVTVCCLVLKNGHGVTGDSAILDPEAFDEAKGRARARERAREKIWELEGYAIRSMIALGLSPKD